MSTLYSVGQMNQLGDALEAAGFSPDDVTKLRQYRSLNNLLLVLNGLAEIVNKTVVESAKKTNAYLRRLFPNEIITLGATDRIETLGDVFTGYVDPDFVNWNLDDGEQPTPETQVTIHEMTDKDGDFKTIYSSLGIHLDKLRLSQGQFKLFAKTHPDKLQKDYATFFLFTRRDEPVNKDKTNLFVADVFFGGSGRLGVLVNAFSRDSVWRARYHRRFVFPQQALVS